MNDFTLPTYERDGYELDDGEQIHRQAPDTFYLPEKAERDNLHPGDSVKVIFRMEQPNTDELSVERMWVEVTQKVGDHYIGVLDNDPYGNVSIKCGDNVVFQAKHVIQTDKR